MTAPQQDTTEILELLGYSIHHEKVQQMLRDFQLEEVLPETLGRKIRGFMALVIGTPLPIPSTPVTEYRNSKRGIGIQFRRKQWFVKHYTGLQYEDDPNNLNELILEDIFYHPKGTGMPLPFGLFWPISSEQLQDRLGQPQSPSVRQGETHWNYLIDGYNVFFRLDQQHQLTKMGVTLCKRTTHYKIQRENRMEEENQSLQPDKIQEILHWKKRKPSKEWREFEMEQWEELGTERNSPSRQFYHKEELAFISAADQVFDQFVEKVVKHTFAKDAIGMYVALQETITELIHLDEMGVGETMERSGIYEFLEGVLEISGFRLYEHELYLLILEGWYG